jgi:pleckstrin domain-containing family G protein 5
MDVHCFLLTDVLLICKAATKKGGAGVRVVRQPYMVDRLIVQELTRDSPSIALVYLNEFRTATAAFILSSSEPKLIKVIFQSKGRGFSPFSQWMICCI